MSRKEKLFFILVLLFFFTLFFSKVKLLGILSVAALVGYSLVYNPFAEKWALLKQRRYLQAMLLFFAWIVISLLFSEHFKLGLSFLDPRLALFYFPLCFGTITLRKKVRDTILLGIALLTTAVSVVCLVYGLYRAHSLQQPAFLYNDALTEVIDLQSIYFALMVNISIYIFSYHILFQKPIYRIGYSTAVLFLFAISYLLASRIMTVTLCVVVLGFGVYMILQRKRYVQGALLLAGLLAGVFIFFNAFPKTLNRFKELAYTQYSYNNLGPESHYNMALDSTQWNGANFRLAAWKCGWELFKTSPVVGVHLGDKKVKLFDVYRQKHFEFAIRTNKNVHNNYLDILYSMGIIGLLLFLLAWIILPIRAALKQDDGLAVLIVLTFAMAWITEIYFDRNLGGMLTGFIIPFLLTYTYQKEPEA